MSRIQAWFISVAATIHHFLVALDTVCTRSGARSVRAALLSQASVQKRKVSLLPNCNSTEASKSALVKLSDGQGREVHARPRSVLSSYNH
jgi:hypothetical protein